MAPVTVSVCVLIVTGENLLSVVAPVTVRTAVFTVTGEKGCVAEGAPVTVSVWVLMTLPAEGTAADRVVPGLAGLLAAGAEDLVVN